MHRASGEKEKGIHRNGTLKCDTSHGEGFLRKAHGLEILWLTGNQIEDLSPLMELANLKKLSVEKNPLDDISLEQWIPSLQSRGVIVSF